MVFGCEPPAFSPKPLPWRPIDPGLNHSQVAALDKALASQDVHLIHGPPGTGKTTAVVELIRQAVLRGERVLACAPSNIAVDNLLERLMVTAAGGKPLRTVRVGHPARLLPSVLRQSLDSLVRTADSAKVADGIREEMTALQRALTGKAAKGNKADSKGNSAGGGESKAGVRKERSQMRRELNGLRKELRANEQKAVGEVLRDAQVVLCTLTGAASKSVQACKFDLLVIDEAAQALEVACMIPMFLAKRCVLAGGRCRAPGSSPEHSVHCLHFQITSSCHRRSNRRRPPRRACL